MQRIILRRVFLDPSKPRYSKLCDISKRYFSMQPPDFDPNVDYYKVLGVPPSAGEKDIKATYYKLAQQYHPDRTGGKTAEKFKEITAAYHVLGNQEKKKQYDTMRTYSQSEQHSARGSGQQGYGGYQSGFGSYNDPFGQFYQQQRQRQQQNAYSQYQRQSNAYQQQQQQQQQDKGSQSKKSGYTYYKTKDGKEYYEFRGDPREFFDEFFKKQQEMFKNQYQQQAGSRKQTNYEDFFKQRDEGRQYQQTHKTQQEEQWKQDNFYKSPFEQWQEDQQNLRPIILMQAFVKSLFFFFGFLLVWRLLFGRKRRIDPMDEYYMQQLAQDPAMYTQMMQYPERHAEFIVHPPPPHPSYSDNRRGYP